MNRIETVSLDKLIPYWRNPRKNDVAVEKVKASIEQFGYQSPIVVDEKMTIIAGHTRYRALKELGYEEIPVIVSDMPAKKAKEYRIIDHRAGEYATWTEDLSLELKEFSDIAFRDIFFPDVQLDPDFQNMAEPVKQGKVQEIEQDLTEQFSEVSQKRQEEPKLHIPCPYCSETITLLRKDVLREGAWE
jgi:hypothetical protein